MDEIWFHLSTQLETLQVQASLGLQQGYNFIVAWLIKCERIFHELCSEQHIQQVKQVVSAIITWLLKTMERVQYQLYSLQLRPREFYQQLGNFCITEVSRREISFCIAGLAVGTLLGCYMGINWRSSSHHMHHVKAIVCQQYIGVDGASVIHDAEMPTIQKTNELLIQVKAASVNIVDAKICSGYSKVYRRLLNSGRHKELPVILGRDCAGIVVDIGQNVINFDIGDEVLVAVPSWAPGTMAEYIVVPETLVTKRPKIFSFEAAASLPYNGCLAWDALVNRSTIEEGNAKGKRILVLGGTTPIGCMLIQLIKLWGGHVTTTCRSNATPVMKALGADEIISINECEKQIELSSKYDAIFYTGGLMISEHILKKHLIGKGSYVCTIPKSLTSDSLGYICGSIFAGCVRFKLLIQYVFGFNTLQWREGAKINSASLQALCDLADLDQLQIVLDRVYAPHNIEQALHDVLDINTIGSIVIKFQ